MKKIRRNAKLIDREIMKRINEKYRDYDDYQYRMDVGKKVSKTCSLPFAVYLAFDNGIRKFMKEFA